MAGYSTTQSAEDPTFGRYNILRCRAGQIASFPLNATISRNGLIVALDFYPYSDGRPTQTIFSIRDTSTNTISLRLDFILTFNTINIWIEPSPASRYYVFDSAITSQISIATGNNKLFFQNKLYNINNILIDAWNHVIVEIVQAQHLSFGLGYSSAKVWVNENGISPVYFGDFSTGDTTIANGNNAALDICGAYDNSSPGLVDSSLTGTFDLMNILWFQGSESVFKIPSSN